MQVVIIGAGIVGASLAFALSQQGADVSVIDASGPAAGATGRSFGWVNASFYVNKLHHNIRAEGIASYRRLNDALHTNAITWSGCLCWEEQGDAFDNQAADLKAMGYDVEVLNNSQFQQLEPVVAPPERALYFPQDAAVDGVQISADLLAASGARLITGCHVEGIETKGGQVVGVSTIGGVIPADRVIVAGGTGSAKLLASLDVELPMLLRPELMMRSQAVKPILSHVLVAPSQEFRQLPSGHILAPTVASHQSDTQTHVSSRPDVLADEAMERLNVLIPSIDLNWEEVAFAQRPVPKDGLPVVGACGPDGVFAAVMHSGITLAPIMAEILAGEVLDKATSNYHAGLIANYRPDRFQNV